MESGLSRVSKTTQEDVNVGTDLRRKCGNSRSPGRTKKAGKVMRLKTPATAMNASTAQEKCEERRYID